MKYKLVVLSITVILISVCGNSCKKHHSDNNGLPPATQTGANTLGFLLNGQVWMPKGFNGSTTNLSVSVDEGYKNGTFNITAYRILSDSNRQYMALGIADSLNFQPIPVTLRIGKQSLFGLSFITNKCTYDFFDTSIYRDGQLILSKFDKANQIISGTFNVILFKSDCGDTVKITNGRFDMHF